MKVRFHLDFAKFSRKQPHQVTHTYNSHLNAITRIGLLKYSTYKLTGVVQSSGSVSLSADKDTLFRRPYFIYSSVHRLYL